LAAFGWELSSLVETSSSDFHNYAVDLRATKGSSSIQVTSSVTVEDQPKIQRQASIQVQTVTLSQCMVNPLAGGLLTVTPGYNIPKKRLMFQVTASYGLASSTFVTVNANREMQQWLIIKRSGD
jgi:hypothetical protein